MKNPIVVIGDVHGLSYWTTAIKENPNCHYVFLGDYLDPYEMTDTRFLLNNLKTIIRFKEQHPDDVTLLFGNHDLHYLSTDIGTSVRFDFSIAEEASQIFSDKFHLFKYAHQIDNYVFIHAGISERWFTEDFCGNPDKNITEQLNNPGDEQLSALYRCGECRGGERGALGGIFWADVRELFEPLQGITQVVGHNRVSNVYEHIGRNGGRIIFCDCLWNEHYLKIDLDKRIIKKELQ